LRPLGSLDKAGQLAILSRGLDNKLRIDLNAVAVLARVVELSGFRGAATALGLPRSTVSLKVAELERQLGVRLLDRTTRVVRPTDACRRYLETARPALDALSDASRRLADLEVEPTGVLRITAPPEAGYFLFGRVIATYLARHPKVRVDAVLTARRVDLVDEGFDLALRAGELADSSLVAHTIGPPASLALCASPAYLKRRSAPRHPSDLAEHDCLVMSDRQEPTRWEFRDKRRRVHVDVVPRVSINSFVVLRDLVVQGHGIAWLPPFLGAPLLASGALRELLVSFRPPPRAYHALYPRSRSLSSKVRAFVDVLAKEGALLAGA
jgi:DNA-binding transcriptional LysR family regulator